MFLTQYYRARNGLTILGLIVIVIIISVWHVEPKHVLAYARDNTIALESMSRHDTIYYPLHVDDTLLWSNKDNMDHKIRITENTTGKLVAESSAIKPYSNFSHTFDKSGMYHFSDPLKSQIGGTVSVSNDIVTNTVSSNMKNNVVIQLTQEPAKPIVGKDTNFVINFINDKTKKDQEHVDYDFVIYDDDGGKIKELYKQGLHSDEGLEQATYKFLKTGQYTIKITIYDILFNPVNPDVATFNITT